MPEKLALSADQFAGSGSASPPVSRIVDVLYGTEKRSVSFKESTDVVVGGIALDQIGKSFSAILSSEDYENAGSAPMHFSRDPVIIPVKLKEIPPYAGSISLGEDPVSGATVTLVGLPCTGKTQEGGYFEFRDCPQARRLLAPKLKLTLPQMPNACANHFALYPPPKLTGIKVNADCTVFETAIQACVSCKPDFPSDNSKINDELCRQEIVAELRRLLPDSWTRWRRGRETPTEGCTVVCHATIRQGEVFVSPGPLHFRAPQSCGDAYFSIGATGFFRRIDVIRHASC